jgi:hypothetical protein
LWYFSIHFTVRKRCLSPKIMRLSSVSLTSRTGRLLEEQTARQPELRTRENW